MIPFQPPCPHCGKYHLAACPLTRDVLTGDVTDIKKETANEHAERYGRASCALFRPTSSVAEQPVVRRPEGPGFEPQVGLQTTDCNDPRLKLAP